MNESRYNHFWLYVLDLHNHHSIGDVRHAVNPTSTYRMEMILRHAVASQDDVQKPAVEVVEIVGTGGTATADASDGLEDLMSGMTISGVKEKKVFCVCTRKCATRKCPCLSAQSACNELCHKNNNTCTNVI